MPRPTAIDLSTLNFAFNGEPFAFIEAKAGIDTPSMNYAFGAQPFFAAGFTGTAVSFVFASAITEAIAASVRRTRAGTFSVAETEAHVVQLRRTRAASLSSNNFITHAAQLRRARSMIASIAETEVFQHTLARLRLQITSITNTHTYSVSATRSRRLILQAITEAVIHSFTLFGTGSVSLSFSVQQAYAHTAAFALNLGLTLTSTELETIAAQVFRARALQSAVAENQGQGTSLKRALVIDTLVAQTQTFSTALNRLRGAVLALFETFNYTFTNERLKFMTTNVNELQVHSFGAMRRTRVLAQLVEAASEYTFDTLMDRVMSVGFPQTQAIDVAIQRSMKLQTSLQEMLAQTVPLSRRRDVLTTIAELETMTSSLSRLRLCAYIISQNIAYENILLKRARDIDFSTSSVESVIASLNRARAFVQPIAQSAAFTVSFTRFRGQAMNIVQTQGVQAAVNRLREIVQSIANLTGYSFSLQLDQTNPRALTVLVTWQEWALVSDAMELQNRSETFAFEVQQSATLPVITEFSEVLVVSENVL